MAKCRMVLGLAAGLWLGAAAPALAQDIEIQAHSQTEFAVYKGDALNMSVQVKGEGVEAKWVKSHETICRALTCQVDTGDWGLGNHKVVVVVFNGKGSLFLRYVIRILAAPAGYKPGKVTPPLVEQTQGIEAIAADDYAVKTLQGRGYSSHKKKVQVVGPLPRAVEWTEKLRTKSGAAMRLWRDGFESHVLAAKSSVQLAKADSGRRALRLNAGTLRSRNLGKQDPRWSVVVGDWLQVDTDAQGDVLVQKLDQAEVPDDSEAEEGDEAQAEAAEQAGGDRVRVLVLRGNARIYRSKAGAGSKGEAIVVPQGLEVTLAKGVDSAPKLVEPDPRRVQALFSETTPEYLLGKKPAEEGKRLTVLQDKQVKTVANAVELAKTANGQRDFFVTIEAFAPHLAEIKGNYEANLLLAEAYRGLYLYDSALPAFAAAAESKSEAPEPHFGMGMAELHKHAWKPAIKHFEDAEDRDYPDEQRLNYYLGIAKFNDGNPVGAKSSFTYSLWDPTNAEIADSAQKFYDRIQSNGWLDLRFGAGLLYDSNVLRAGDDLDLETVAEGKIENKKSAGYLGGLGFTLWPVREEGVHAYLGFDIVKTVYLEKSLEDLAVLDQRLSLGAGFQLIGEAGERKLLSFDLDGYARLVGLGEERSMDMLGGTVTLGSPRLLDLSLRVESVLALDPLPARDDVLDPVLWEVVPAGERSVHLKYYGLGLRPVDGRVFKLGLDAKSGGGTYRSALHRNEDFKDTQIRLDLAVATSLRNELGLGVQQLKRDFFESEDARKDSNLTIDLGWKWHYTTALYHRLSLANEAQTSSRDVNAYKRQAFMYKLNLDF